MRQLILSAILGATLLWSVSSAAQERPKLAILIESLSQDAATCGITESSLESIAALTLRNNGIQVMNDLPISYLYVSVNTIAMSTHCATNTAVSVRMRGPVSTGRFKRRGGEPTILLCSKGSMDVGVNSRHAKAVNDTLEQGIKLCLGELDY